MQALVVSLSDVTAVAIVGCCLFLPRGGTSLPLLPHERFIASSTRRSVRAERLLDAGLLAT